MLFFSSPNVGPKTDHRRWSGDLAYLWFTWEGKYWKRGLFNLWPHLQAVFPTLSYHLQRWNHPDFCYTCGRICWVASGTKVPTKNPFKYTLTYKPCLLGCLALPIWLLRFFSLSLFSKHLSPYSGDFLCLVFTARHLSSQNRCHSHVYLIS